MELFGFNFSAFYFIHILSEKPKGFKFTAQMQEREDLREFIEGIYEKFP